MPASPRRAYRRLDVEALEDRLPPAIAWANASGGDCDTGSNWLGGMVPGTSYFALISFAVSKAFTESM
jgi:hypothetical protein